jgi:hypothetical protein
MNTYVIGLKNGEKLKVKGFLKSNFLIGDKEGAGGYNVVAHMNQSECLYIIKIEHLEEPPQTP